MYVIAISRRTRWLIAGIAVVALLLLTTRVASPSVAEREDSRPAMAAAIPAELRPIYSAKTEQKVVALTFDISWGQVMAPKILDILKQENLKATFFLSGPWSRNHQELVARIKADGHEIESHGQAHVDLNTLGREGAARNIADAHAILQQLTGRAPAYIRPPNGAFNEQSVLAAQDLGYKTIIWSVDSLDWKNPGVDTIINRTTRLIHPGAIVLMHASDSCKQTDQALPTVIKTLREQGYNFVLLDDLVKKYGPDMNGFIHTKLPQ